MSTNDVNKLLTQFIFSRRQGLTLNTIKFYKDALRPFITRYPLTSDGINAFLSSLTCKTITKADKDAWNLEDAYLRGLYEKSLNDLLREGYLEAEETRTGVRNFPVGLLSWWRDVVHQEDNLSLSKLQRISVNHGVSIASHDPRIKEVVNLYSSKMREARDKRDKQLTKVLEEKGGTLNFISEAKYSTSVGLVKRVEGPLSALSAALGIPVTKLIIYLSLLSMMTLGNCGWKEMLKEDMEMFWNYVEQRKKTLK